MIMKKNDTKHKAGFVTLIGNPNVGKSTLINALVGERLSIITRKAQTTRHRIMGIVSGEGFQIVYSDTPGVIVPNYKLQEWMMQTIDKALSDSDVLLYVAEEKALLKNAALESKIKNTNLPLIILINKIDLSDEDKVKESMVFWKDMYPESETIPISAKLKFNTEKVFNTILDNLPYSPAYFDKEEFTTKSERFFVGEIIREKILTNYTKEIPYSVEVEIQSFKEDDTLIRISAIIFAARQSQKGILIGHEGKMLKKVGTEARKDMEDFFRKRIFLELFVKVRKNWRENEKDLKKFGYED
jgi:GTP-binding protein Era